MSALRSIQSFDGYNTFRWTLNQRRKEMNPQTIKSKNKIRQDLLNDVNAVWQIVEALEKRSQKMFGHEDPTTHTLGFACVHLMNASSEIEEQISKSNKNLNPKSVDQLLEILSAIRWSGPKHRFEILVAYRKAVKDVSAKHNIERNTVADLCVRRLGYTGKGATFKFVDLVEDWLMKEGVALQNLIKIHTHNHQHQKIDRFFGNGGIIR